MRWGKYAFRNGEFLEIERLYYEAKEGEDYATIWFDEVLKNGEWQIRRSGENLTDYLSSYEGGRHMWEFKATPK